MPDDPGFLTNKTTKTEPLLYRMDQTVKGIDLCVNVDITNFIYFKLELFISTLSVIPLKIVDQFEYLSTIISSTESDVNMHIRKKWAAIDT